MMQLFCNDKFELLNVLGLFGKGMYECANKYNIHFYVGLKLKSFR